MKIIIEGYPYEAQHEKVREVLHDLNPLESLDRKISVNYVGYYYNPEIRDYIFVLPKVLLNKKDTVFSRYNPHDIIDIGDDKKLSSKERCFIYDFSIWIYRSIVVFNKHHPENDIIHKRHIAELGKSKYLLNNTFIDILLSLLAFNKENQQFLISVLRNIYSGYNKINWTKTINQTTALIQENEPIYLKPVNKKRQINYEEELLVIYLSILNYISDTYGFPVSLNLRFDLIIGKQFKHYLKGYGKRRLKQIKYQYFSDKSLKLWELCYAFFDRAHRINIVVNQREYLLAKNYNIIFEAIVDDLIGDGDIPSGLKEQEDGKRVDHIYSYQSLTTTEKDQIYYIGDSKYYKLGGSISKESVYKQFTYARNVIQWNMDLFLDEKIEEDQNKVPKYRDDVTEGYNIVPNFFISAKMNEDLSYSDNVSETDRANNTFISRQFENRLFDRDTLLVYHYDVNFLYVVSLYARENEYQKSIWRDKVRKIFKEKIQKKIQENYSFYAMTPKVGIISKAFIHEHFKDILGKIYMPYSDNRYFSLALENSDPDGTNDFILETLREGFVIEPCKLGQDPREVVELQHVFKESVVSNRQGVLLVMIYIKDVPKLFADYRVAIGLKQTKSSVEIIRNLENIGYILVHEKKDDNKLLYKITNMPNIASRDEILDAKISAPYKTTELYLVLDFESSDISSNKLSIDGKVTTQGKEAYDPHLEWISNLLVE